MLVDLVLVDLVLAALVLAAQVATLADPDSAGLLQAEHLAVRWMIDLMVLVQEPVAPGLVQ